MEMNLTEELDQLRKAAALATPAARLRAIKQQLVRSEQDKGLGRLLIVLAGVEALARSLVVHASGRPSSTAEMRYRQFRPVGPVELVEECLRLRNAQDPATLFGKPTWELFQLADQCRTMALHECTYLSQEKYIPLTTATEAILQGLVEVAELPRVVS